MTRKTALIAAAVLFSSAAMAQTSTTAPPAKPTPHQPGVAAAPSAGQTAAAKASTGKVDPAKEVLIRKLMEITQSSKLGDNINKYISNQVQGGMRQVLPPDRLTIFMTSFDQKLATGAPPSAVAAAMVPYYDKALSLEDLQGLITFYESPLGQRTLKALPQVVSETEGMGTQMQQKAAMAVLQSMAGDYPELKAMLAPPPGASGGAGSQQSAPVQPVK